MIPARIKEIKARLHATSPGPWNVLYLNHKEGAIQSFRVGKEQTPPTNADMNFISHARGDLPVLMEVIDELNKYIDMLEANSGVDITTLTPQSDDSAIKVQELQIKLKELEDQLAEARAQEEVVLEEQNETQERARRQEAHMTGLQQRLKELEASNNPAIVTSLQERIAELEAAAQVQPTATAPVPVAAVASEDTTGLQQHIAQLEARNQLLQEVVKEATQLKTILPSTKKMQTELATEKYRDLWQRFGAAVDKTNQA